MSRYITLDQQKEMEANYKGWFEITEYIGVNKKIGRDGGGTGVEGNIGKYFGKIKGIEKAISYLSSPPKNILEIGFNAGHSAMVMLNSTPDSCNFYTFTLDNHAYSQPCFDIIKSVYPKRNMQITFGDSQYIVPEFLETFNEELDLVFIDGAHSEHWPHTDAKNTHHHLKVGGIMIFDDINIGAVGKGKNKFLKEFPNQYKHLSDIKNTGGHDMFVLQKIK